MADDKQSTAGIQLGFLSGVFRDQPDRLHLLGAAGQEELSQLFEYAILLSSPSGPLSDDELEGLVREPCAIALGTRPGDVVHGVLREIEMLDTSRQVAPRYVARLVPQIALLAQLPRSAIYQSTTIPKLVEEVLASYGLAIGTHFEILISDDVKCAEHEYIVQYEESDWDFLQRWLEREGYFYWITHSANGAKLVVADANDDTTPIDDPSVISFRERNNLIADGKPTIWDLRVRQHRMVGREWVVDYNYRRPKDMLLASEPVDDGGFGTAFRYGEHYKNKDAGSAIAKTRAERHQTLERTITAATNCARFRVGHSFELENHHIPGRDGRYLLTKILHRVGHDVDAALQTSSDHAEATVRPYNATFEAIPIDTPFRPDRRTPWPRIAGFISGHIEADSSGEYAQIDDQGRYKVKMTFDVGTKRGLSASRPIRMAQPYAGAGYGIHFPLHKGTEVLIGHTGGDPDRPLIIGSVPNPHTPSPVVSSNATQSIIDTASGIRVEFEDLQK